MKRRPTGLGPAASSVSFLPYVHFVVTSLRSYPN
jgi:hypothetical protein